MGLAAYRYLARAVGDAGEAQWATARVQQLARGHQRHTHRDDSPLPPRLPALLDARAQHREPVQEPEGRQLGGTVPLRPMGVGRATLRRGCERAAASSSSTRRTRTGSAASRASCRRTPSAGTRRTTTRPVTTRDTAAARSASTRYRDQGILSYEFMVDYTQSGPYSWWESASAPSTELTVGREPPHRRGRIFACTRGASRTRTRSCSTRSSPRRPTAR